MIETIPDYYSQFHCIAEKCSDTCCAGWEIVIDKNSLKKYRKWKGAFANRLHNEIDFQQAHFLQYNKRCAFLNEDNLCDLYSEGGKESLCKTCRQYPRHVEEFEDVREISLSLSCPEAARIILTNKGKVSLISKEKTGEENFGNFDNFLYSALEDTRERMMQIMQDRSCPINERLCYVLAMSHDIQRKINHRKLFDVETFLNYIISDHAKSKARQKFQLYQNKNKQKFEICSKMFKLLWKMEFLQENWETTLSTCRDTLYEDYDGYCKFNQYKLGEIVQEQLMVYFLYTYFCGAVYDENEYAKVKFGLVMILFIQEISKALCVTKNHLRDEQVIWVSYKISREIEHSEQNINTFEEMVTKDPLFSMDNLMICLLN